MAQIEAVITLTDIQQIVKQIVARFQPQKIILFGSYAHRTSITEDSDVDLLVLMETDEQPLHTAARIAAAFDHPFPLDIIVATPTNFEASVARRGVFATQVTKEGIVLYETVGSSQHLWSGYSLSWCRSGSLSYKRGDENG